MAFPPLFSAGHCSCWTGVAQTLLLSLAVPKTIRPFCCRSPVLWDQPDEFDPDRFGPLEGPAPNEVTEDFKYLPFGGGKRKCIGECMGVWYRFTCDPGRDLVGIW